MIAADQPIILSFGGSLIYPNGGIDIKFLRKFDSFIRQQVSEGKKFFIVCGGGQISRKYRDALKEIIQPISNDDLDWIGIHATRINGHLIRTIFKDISDPFVIDKYDKKYDLDNYPLVVCAGWKPGWSTDYCAVKLAENYHAKTIINLSNIDMVYDKDPKEFKDATPIEKTSWEYFQKLVGDKWDPGLNIPFDPIASQLATKLGLTVVILRGHDLQNLENVLEGKKFKGTVISPFETDAGFYDREHFEDYKISGVRKYGIMGQVVTVLRDFYRALKVKIFLKPKNLLSVGCGTGEMVHILRLLGVDAHGLEISKYLISMANSDIKDYVKLGSILDIPYKDSSFDVVTTSDVLEHISTDDLNKAVSECNRVAKKYVLHKIFTSENVWIKKTHPVDVSHVSIFGRNWWIKFWQQNGFKQAPMFYPGLPSFMETLFLLNKKSN